MTGPRLDIVIVNYNTRDELVACLTSVRDAPPRGLGTVFVVDNASKDDSVEAARAAWPAADVIALDSNVGFAAANNVAQRRATATHVLLLNSDTIVPAGALDALVDRAIATGALAAGPRLVDARGLPEMSFGPMLTPLGEARQALRVRLAAAEAPWARRRIARLVAVEREVDWVSGACLLVERAAALAAGLLDERYFMYEEDVDFCAALRARGGRILYTPVAEIVHLRGRSLAASGAGHAFYDRSHLAFYAKHAPRWVPWLRLWLRLRGRGIG